YRSCRSRLRERAARRHCAPRRASSKPPAPAASAHFSRHAPWSARGCQRRSLRRRVPPTAPSRDTRRRAGSRVARSQRAGGGPMAEQLARNWGWVALRGVLALVFGLITLFTPAMSLEALIFYFGIFAFV